MLLKLREGTVGVQLGLLVLRSAATHTNDISPDLLRGLLDHLHF